MSTEGMFTPEELLNLGSEGSMETRISPIPEGEHQAYISKLDVRQGVSDKNGKPWVTLDVTWTVTTPEAIEATGLDNPTVRQSIFLDFDENGVLAMGKAKNVQLGRLRDALGQNGSGPWKMSMLEGAAGVVRVEHREYKGDKFADVKGVSAF